jgi:hypothetical protein
MNPVSTRRLAVTSVVGLLLAITGEPYPLDGARVTGIRRLEGYQAAQAARDGTRLPPGALLGTGDIRLTLAATNPDWDLRDAAKDTELQAALEQMLLRRDSSYAIAVIDISDPQKIAWAGVREDRAQLPGSVGKIGVMVALFDGLRRAFPDVAQRQKVLRERIITAEDWVVGDPHKTPHFDPASGRNRFSVIVEGERFNLAEWIDHMISASANSAGSTVWKEAMLLRRFGSAYPPSTEIERDFFQRTPRAELSALAVAVINEPLAAAGVDLKGFRQGTMFTRAGQRRVPGISSYATPRALAQILLRLEQGRLVDPWSSLEMKRFLYMTKKRYRYVYAPELSAAAVYFKSGSFYRCRPEEGFSCGKYKGNVQNLMNSIAIIESPAAPGAGQKRYIVALLSDVLRVNSAWDHSRIGAAIEQAVHTRKAATITTDGTAVQLLEVGVSD